MPEPGWTEPFRVQFPETIGNVLNKLATIESRSIPNLIRDLTIEALVKRQIEEVALSIKEELIRNGGNGQLVKTGTQ